MSVPNRAARCGVAALPAQPAHDLTHARHLLELALEGLEDSGVIAVEEVLGQRPAQLLGGQRDPRHERERLREIGEDELAAESAVRMGPAGKRGEAFGDLALGERGGTWHRLLRGARWPRHVNS